MRNRKMAALLCLALCLALLCGCSAESAVENEEANNHIVGLALYSQTDPEQKMFFDYYRNYIAASFPVEFLAPETISSTEEEIAFLRAAKEQGAQGIISFYGLGLREIVAACEELELYYVLGSSSISDEDFNAVKDNPWFLGVIGPDSQEEFQAGTVMAETFLEQGASSFLIVSGGAGMENFMHRTRVMGMLTALQEQLGLTYGETVDSLASVTEITQVETGRDDVSIVISPGYLQTEEGLEHLRSCFAADDYDALLSAVSIIDAEDDLREEIASSGKELLVGVVDCFSEANYQLSAEKSAGGCSVLNFVQGKYASMVAPAFVAVCNAIEGDLDVVNPNGEAFRLYQTYWTAHSEEEYEELYGYTQSIYENAYSSVDLMSVIKAYNAEADFEQFRTLAESSDLESVRERLKK